MNYYLLIPLLLSIVIIILILRLKSKQKILEKTIFEKHDLEVLRKEEQTGNGEKTKIRRSLLS